MRNGRSRVRGIRPLLLVAGVFAFLAFSGIAAHAQTTGKVIGTVTDRDTGQPLVGAQVVVQQTNLGNVTNEDGYYFINNVPVGVQEITAQYLGYQTQTNEQRVLAGQTMTVDFALSSEVVQAEAITAVIEREPLVARDNTISKTRFTAEDAQDLPVDNISQVITLGAGVYTDLQRGGFVVRGGRATETATFIDGALVTDFTLQNNSTTPGSFAIEEVDVITGGFNAEFGHAQSGIINIVTREGGREYHGNLRFTTDELEVEQSFGYNNLQASIGGPIVPELLTFFGSLEATGAEDFFPAAAGFNPAQTPAFRVVGDRVIANSDGSTEAVLPGNRGDRMQAQGKLSSFLPFDAKATATYLFSRAQNEFFDNRLHTEQFRGLASRTKTHDVIVGYDQMVFQTAERNLQLQVRGNFHLTDFVQGMPRSPELAAVIGDRLGAACGAECDVSENTFEDDFLNFRFDDVEFFFEDSIPGAIPNLPSRNLILPDPVFGIPGLNVTRGIFSTFAEDRDERRYGIRVDLDSQLTRVHRAKVGFEWNWINLERTAGNLTSSTFAQNFDVDPRVGAAYVQDRLDYGDLVIDLGLRWDHWDPNTVFPAVETPDGQLRFAPGLVNCEIAGFPDQCTEGAATLEAQTRDELAPRIGVAHPITDATQVRLSYGKFYQLPRLGDFFSSFTTNFPGNPNIFFGNPNLDFIETTAFEAGITHLISENLVLDVVGYNRDRRGAVRLEVFQPDEIAVGLSERRVFVNGDDGNVKGLDLTLSKRFSNFFSTDLAWSLQWARGTTSSPIDWVGTGGFGRLTDPLNPPDLLLPPVQLQPEDFDRLHNLNWQFQLRFPDDFREGTATGRVFENFGVFLIYNAQSGNPFTRREPNSRSEPVEDLGSSRLPWIHSGDIRVTKGFDIGDQLDLSVFGFVRNFLDVENVIRVNETTGRAEFSGFETDALAFTWPNNTNLFIDGEAPGVFPARGIPVENLVESFEGVPVRERMAKQDLNGDGFITEGEARSIASEATRTRQVIGGPNANVFGDDPFNYGAPRQIRFGAEIRF